jgi:hypothetical protein
MTELLSSLRLFHASIFRLPFSANGVRQHPAERGFYVVSVRHRRNTDHPSRDELD